MGAGFPASCACQTAVGHAVAAAVFEGISKRLDVGIWLLPTSHDWILIVMYVCTYIQNPGAGSIDGFLKKGRVIDIKVKSSAALRLHFLEAATGRSCATNAAHIMLWLLCGCSAAGQWGLIDAHMCASIRPPGQCGVDVKTNPGSCRFSSPH